MKRFIFIVLFFSHFCSHGQQIYYAIPDSNVIWKEYAFWLSWPGPGSVDDDYHLYISGDTLVGGYNYKKLYRTGNLNGFIFYYDDYKAAFRQDNTLKQVFILPENSSFEELLYDFNLNIGDTLPTAYNNIQGNVVFDIDSVLVGNYYHKRFLLNPLNWPNVQPDTNYAIIEGVGSTFGFYQMIKPNFEGTSFLECFSHDTVYYPSMTICPLISDVEENNFTQFGMELFPNPVFRSSTIRLNTYLTQGSLILRDILGKELNRQHFIGSTFEFNRAGLQNGIYFISILDSDKIQYVQKVIIVD